MNIKRIHSELLLKGIDSYSSWLGKGDGPYMVCRPYNSHSNKAEALLIPIADEQDDMFIDAIKEKIIKLAKEGYFTVEE